HRAAAGRPVGAPLAPDPVAVLDGGRHLDPQIGHVGYDLGPVGAHVLAARDLRAGMTRSLADVVLAEELEERVEIVRVQRAAHLLQQRNHPGTSSGPRAGRPAVATAGCTDSCRLASRGSRPTFGCRSGRTATARAACARARGRARGPQADPGPARSRRVLARD